MELFATLDDDVKEESFYVAVGFSDDDMMVCFFLFEIFEKNKKFLQGDETVSECSRLINEKTPTVKVKFSDLGNNT